MGGYIPLTDAERRAMLDVIGAADTDDLYRDVPKEVRVSSLELPQGKPEFGIASEFKAIAKKNTEFDGIFRGAGAYCHYIPAAVKNVVSKEEFVTAYTPYQAEISQGVLQSIFEYQTMICELTGMDVSNASVYDGAQAAAEAVSMCAVKRRRALISAAANPQTIATIRTYCEGSGVEVELIPERDGFTDLAALKNMLGEDAACVYVQNPNFFGVLEDSQALCEAAHAAGALFIAGCEPISLGMIAPPGEFGADIAVGEGQPLGMPLEYGGPYLGFMACKKEHMRRLPGRIVGETVDHEGRRAFVLTLQAREQHIRREKAGSNICSNEALCALTAAAYLSVMGPQGLKKTAELCWNKAHYLRDRLTEIDGVKQLYGGEFFDEFVASCPIDAHELEKKLAEKGMLSGLPVEGGVLWCATEVNTREQIDALVEAVKEACR